MLLRLAVVGVVVLSGLAEAAASPDRAPGDLTVEVGLYGGLFFASDRHELFESPSVPHRRLERPAPELGLRAAFFPSRFVGIEAEAALVPWAVEGGGNGTGYVARGHLIGQFPARFTPFLLVGGGGLGIASSSDELGDDSDAAFHWGGGIKAYLSDLLSLRVDGRHIVTSSLDDFDRSEDPGTTSHFELLLGFALRFPRPSRTPPDPDGDGVTGTEDACPEEKGAAPTGCPPRDADLDGVVDDEDRCPNVSGLGEDGCPPPDADGDDVPDARDACPSDPGPRSTRGCPDRDGDRVPDSIDRCPDRGGIAPYGCPSDDPDGDGFVAEADRCPNEAGEGLEGCPDQDQDGIADADDDCPAEAETRNDFEDQDGCPDEVPDAVANITGRLEGIRFGRSSARIRPSSRAALNRVLEVLQTHPSLRLEIDGHTDSTGDRERNMALSQARADAVRSYLVQRGISDDRLVARGFGPDQPLDTNRTATGRARNRRIELRLLP